MATGWVSPSKENLNFARLCRLLIDGGTRVLRHVFDSIHSPSTLHTVLHSTPVHTLLQGLRAKRVLTVHQWDSLYPRTTPVSSGNFDITLLFILLRNICGLTPPPTGWDKPPATSDLSKEADLARIKLYRNELCHIPETAVSDADFEKLWADISAVLTRLGGPHYKPDVDRLKVETMDFDDEKYFIKIFEEWGQLGDGLHQNIKKVLKPLKDDPFTTITSRAEDYTRKLKSSIKRQTESLPVLDGDTVLTIDDVFTNVTIKRVEKDQEKTKSVREQLDVFQASSTTLKKCSEIFVWPENDDPNSRTPTTTNPKCILLTGKAGIGKSEFCRKMSRDWSQDGISDFKFLFLLTYRQLSLLDHEELDLCDILNQCSLVDEQSMIDKGLLQYMIENPEKVLIIFDGYDEYGYRTEITGDFETKYPNDPRQKMPLPAMIAKIMKGKIQNGSVVIISSRPEEAQELKRFPFDVRCEIKGFSPLQVQEFIQKYFKEDKSMKKAVLDHIKRNEILLRFGHIPKICFLMCYYLKWHMTQTKTIENLSVANLFFEVIKVFITRYSYTQMTEAEVEEILYKLAELAIYLMREKKIIFTEEDMMKSFNFSKQELTNLKKSGLFDCCPGVKKSPFEKPPLEFVFSHLTMQEFLCALGFVEKKQLPEKEGTSEMIWTFMAGLLGRKNDEKLMDQLIKELQDAENDDRSQELTLQCLYEYRVINKLHNKEIKIPLEIIARGPNAEKAYQQAIKEGKVQVYRGRIMLIGQDRAGKTSLKKSLLGLRFDPQEPSTVGVDVDPSRFSVDVDSAIEWKKLEETPINDFDDYIARVTAEKLNKEAQELGKPEPEIESEPELEPEPKPDVMPEPEPVSEKNEQEKSEPANDIPALGSTAITLATETVPKTPPIPDVLDNISDDSNSSKDDVDTTRKKDEFKIADRPSKEITEKIIQYLSAKNLDEISPEDKVTVSIWDFAGQQLYYASHPVFFSPRAVYVLVYNLSKDLKKEAAPCVRQGIHEIMLDNHEKQTNLEAILSWLVSVHSVRPQDDGKSKEGDELPYLRPPVVIVGTHADRPFEDVRKMEAIIQKSLSEKSYDEHVVTFIAVNNVISSNDKGVQKLRNKVNELFRTEPYMEKSVPVRWLRFEKAIKSLVNEKGIHHLPLEELEKVVLEVCHIEDQDEIEAMLNFYHDLGDIVKYGKTVVLKTEWLIDVFKRLITIRPFNALNPRLRRYWKELEKKGVLDMELVNHVFKDLIGRQGSRTQKDILEMMTEYGLIAKFGTENNFHYFVPAQLQSSPTEPLDSKLKASDPCALYIHFPDGFIPHGLYYCLVSKVIGWCSESKYLEEPKLHKNVSQFGIGCSQEYKLQLICRKAFIKVVLSSRQPERSLDFKPAFKVRKKLEDCLEEMKNKCHGYGSITYEICVRCPQCATSDSDDDCLPLLRVTKDPKNPAKLVLVCKGEMHDEVPDIPGTEILLLYIHKMK